MAEHQFTLVLQGTPESDETIDALFHAGCADATFGTVDNVGYADFIREAPSLSEAIRSAIRAIESVPDLRILRINLGARGDQRH
jgi:hypothetical protein